MVKATVYKDGNPKSRNHKIRLARQRADILLDAVMVAKQVPQKFIQRFFRRCPLASDARHDLAAFLDSESVNHENSLETPVLSRLLPGKRQPGEDLQAP